WHHRLLGSGDLWVLESEPGTGPADTGLDFVKDQQGTVVVTGFAYLLQKPGRVIAHACLTLDRFDDHGRNRIVQFCAQRVDISGGYKDHAAREWFEWSTVLGLPCQCQRAHRATVESVFH